MFIVETCGLLSSTLISAMFVPQVVHTWRARDASGLSYGFLLTNLVASALGLVYSVYCRILPMMLANISASLFSLSILWIKSECSRPRASSESV
jgi:uncharacterized protein with PQ loop repeat